jgi:hypothetical protein
LRFECERGGGHELAGVFLSVVVRGEDTALFRDELQDSLDP